MPDEIWQHRISRRRSLVLALFGVAQAAVGPCLPSTDPVTMITLHATAGRWASAALARAVYVDQVGTAPADIQTALDAGAGKTVVFSPSHRYVMDRTLTAASGTTIIGNGATLQYPNDSTLSSLLDLDNRTGIEISGLVFDGNVAGQTTWDQTRHAIRVRDSSSLAIHHNTFTNLIGDGIYVSHVAGATAPYTGSSDIDIHDNTFTGANANRNGVSLICGKRLRVHGNGFYRMARTGMPGAIDLEPNNADEFLVEVTVTGNTIDGGTNSPATPPNGIQLQNPVGATLAGVTLDGNAIGGAISSGVYILSTEALLKSCVIAHNTIHDLTGTGSTYGVLVQNGARVVVTGNTITNVQYGIYDWASNVSATNNIVRDATIQGFEQGTSGSAANIKNNTFHDCGRSANGTTSGAVHIKSSGGEIVGNRITASSTANTQTGIYVESGIQNRIDGNAIAGVGFRSVWLAVAPQMWGADNVLDPTRPGVVSGTYPPVIGRWAAGQRVYAFQPAAGAAPGWVCVKGGTPGKWRAMASWRP